MERPNDVSMRKARTNLRSLSSDGPSRLPSLNLIADAIRLQLEKRRKVAILYVNLQHYGRLEPMFGWRVVADILDAVAASLEGMAGSTLRQLDAVSDFTLTDDAFIVLLSPPRGREVISDDDLAAVMRRVHERLRSVLLNDLAPGVYDRVFPAVGAAVLSADDALTFEQCLERGIALAMQAADDQAEAYAADLEKTLVDCVERGEFEALFEPVVDLAAEIVIGYRSTVRGPFHSPLRLPDVLLDVAQRSAMLVSYGVVARSCTVRSAAGLRPDDLLFLNCAAAELPNAAVVALSEFYSLNPALVPQHVVFDLGADEVSINTASTMRTLAGVREMGFQLCLSGVGAQITTLALIAETKPDFLCLDSVLLANLGADPTAIEVIQLLVRFSGRIGAQLIATGVQDAEDERLLARSGVELFSGELFAQPDTRLPSASFKH
ncbi:MAG TPA: EAL domain-containing protein [Thermoleophilia bacterium]|nr:EAL domain-containing protein [Thermoleophilia bacterium]